MKIKNNDECENQPSRNQPFLPRLPGARGAPWTAPAWTCAQGGVFVIIVKVLVIIVLVIIAKVFDIFVIIAKVFVIIHKILVIICMVMIIIVTVFGINLTVLIIIFMVMIMCQVRVEEEEGEIQQCEERLLFLCDTLSNSLVRDAANPTKLAQVGIITSSDILFTSSSYFQVLGSTFSSVVELMLGQEVTNLFVIFFYFHGFDQLALKKAYSGGQPTLQDQTRTSPPSCNRCSD